MGRLLKKWHKLFPRSSKTDYSTDEYKSPRSHLRAFSQNLDHGRHGRPPDLSVMSHFGLPFGDRQLQLSRESRDFIRHLTSAGLSHLLIWYIHHDVVPFSQSNRHWYLELPREEIVGWIRFGRELSRGLALQNATQFPPRLLDVIDDLHLQLRDVFQRLIRLSNFDDMRKHELAEFDFNQNSSYLAAGDKLDADKRMVQNLRPISKTMWADMQSATLEWIEACMELVVRPVIDPLKSSKQSDKQTNGPEMRRLFRSVCAHHLESPIESIYTQALDKPVRVEAEAILLSHHPAFATHEHAWFSGLSTVHEEPGLLPSARVHSSDARRRSAPMINKSTDALIAFGERMDIMKEDMDALAQEKMHLEQSDPDAMDGRVSRGGYRSMEEEPKDLPDGVDGPQHDHESVSTYSVDEIAKVGLKTDPQDRLRRTLAFSTSNHNATRSTPNLAAAFTSHGDTISRSQTPLANTSSPRPLRSSGLTRVFDIPKPPQTLPRMSLGPTSPPPRRGTRSGRHDDHSSIQSSHNGDIYHTGPDVRFGSPLSKRNGIVHESSQALGSRSSNRVRWSTAPDGGSETRVDSAHRPAENATSPFDGFSGVHCEPLNGTAPRKTVKFDDTVNGGEGSSSSTSASRQPSSRESKLKDGEAFQPEAVVRDMREIQEAIESVGNMKAESSTRYTNGRDDASLTTLDDQDSLRAAAALARRVEHTTLDSF